MITKKNYENNSKPEPKRNSTQKKVGNLRLKQKEWRKVKASKKEEKLDKINKKYWFGLSIEWTQNDVIKP